LDVENKTIPLHLAEAAVVELRVVDTEGRIEATPNGICIQLLLMELADRPY